MTLEEAKKLVKGDVVLVRGVVDDLGSQYPAGELLLNFENPGEGVQRTRIPRCAVHSVLPRPLAVGDRVTWSEGRTSSSPGEIVAQDNGWFWVRWSPTSHDTLSAIELVRAP